MWFNCMLYNRDGSEVHIVRYTTHTSIKSIFKSIFATITLTPSHHLAMLHLGTVLPFGRQILQRLRTRILSTATHGRFEQPVSRCTYCTHTKSLHIPMHIPNEKEAAFAKRLQTLTLTCAPQSRFLNQSSTEIRTGFLH